MLAGGRGLRIGARELQRALEHREQARELRGHQREARVELGADVVALGGLELVDRAVDRRAGGMPTLTVRSCEKLEGHDVAVGERVPCVAVVGNRSARGKDNTYHFISPMPVAWATPDKAVLRRVEKEIPAGEWEKLRQNLDRYEEVAALPTHLLPLD